MWSERFKSLFYGFLMLILILGGIGSCLHGRKGPSQGEPCGPEHHWQYVGPMIDPDLSCEPDR